MSMTLYGSQSCVHCRSVKNLLLMKGLLFEFIELREETDEVRLVENGVTYTGLDEITNYLKGR